MLGFENSAFGGHANRARLSAALRPDRDLNPGLHRSSLLSLRRIKNLFRFSQQLMKQVERVISLASRRTGHFYYKKNCRNLFKKLLALFKNSDFVFLSEKKLSLHQSSNSRPPRFGLQILTRANARSQPRSLRVLQFCLAKLLHNSRPENQNYFNRQRFSLIFMVEFFTLTLFSENPARRILVIIF